MEQLATIGTEKHPITEGIKNYLTMNTSGALLVTGDWGCGKTHYFKNELFDEIISERAYTPIMVSLFGLTELKEIPERILYAYLDKVGNEAVSIGKIARYIKNFADALPVVKKFVDMNKLLGSGEGLYRMIPSNVLICFDDMERAIDSIKINDILGVVNELVENKNYKVIIITNERFIEKEELIFKEKVIEKTFKFSPNTIKIFSILVDSHKNNYFSKFMQSAAIISTVNPYDNSIKEFKGSNLSKNLSNIRIIKFAIEHFYPVFSHYTNQIKDGEEIEDITKKKLRNFWIFILSTSIEYKINNLSFENNHGIDSYEYIADVVTALSNKNKEFEKEDEENKEQELKGKSSKDHKYCKQFHKKYFQRLSETLIFHLELYKCITGGIAIDYTLLDENANRKLGVVKNAVNSAHELLEQFKEYWKFTNEQIPTKLQELLNYAQEGRFNDYISYIHATAYLMDFKEISNLLENDIISRVKEGVDKYTEQVEINDVTKTRITTLEGLIPPNVNDIYNYIIESIDRKLVNDLRKESEEIKSLFQENTEKLLLRFSPKEYDTTPQYFNVPILKNIDSSIIENKINHIEPYEAMCLRTLIIQRYIQILPTKNLKEELSFLECLVDNINKMDSENKMMSTFILKRYVCPELNKAISRLRSL